MMGVFLWVERWPVLADGLLHESRTLHTGTTNIGGVEQTKEKRNSSLTGKMSSILDRFRPTRSPTGNPPRRGLPHHPRPRPAHRSVWRSLLHYPSRRWPATAHHEQGVAGEDERIHEGMFIPYPFSLPLTASPLPLEIRLADGSSLLGHPPLLG